MQLALTEICSFRAAKEMPIGLTLSALAPNPLGLGFRVL